MADPRGAALPGADLIEQGLADLRAGDDDTVASLLVEIGAPRLRRLGIAVPPLPPRDTSSELVLYLALAADGDDDALSRYNALTRRLVSFERALELEAAIAARARARNV